MRHATDPDGVLAVIPAYNEAGRIVAVIEGLLAIGLPVLVVDDGSRDGTGDAARAAGARVLRKINGGKGTAILAGCAWAIERGFAKVVLLDGDGQHDPREALRLIRSSGRADLVIGKRVLGLSAQPLYRRVFNRLSSLLVTLAAGRRIIDSQSGFRMCDPRLLLRLPLAGLRYDLESELCVLAARAGMRISEVPISVIYNDKRSGVHPVYDTARFVRAVARSVVSSRPRLRPVRIPAAATPLAPAAAQGLALASSAAS